MNSYEIEHIIKAHFKRLKKYARPLRIDPGKESIHEFRLQVKKLRAFLRLLSIEEGMKAPLNIPRELKQLYAITGHIRDLQLLHDRILHDCKLDGNVSGYPRLLKKSTEKYIARAKELLKGKPFGISKKKIIRKIPERLQTKTFDIFFGQKQDNILSLINSGNVEDTVLHSIRKLIKDITFLVKLAESSSLVTRKPWNSAAIEKAESLAHELGLFNDNCIALGILKPGNLEKLSPEERQLLQSFCRQLESENAHFKQYFQRELPRAEIRSLFNIYN